MKSTRPLAVALDLVEPFASTDETRPNICRPARYSGCVVATDGHTMAVARYDGEGRDPNRELDQSAHDAPPWQYVVPKKFDCIGELGRLPACFDHYPAKWDVAVTLAVGGGARASAAIPARLHARTNKVLATRVPMFEGSPLEGFEELRPEEPIGLNARYLARCVRCVTLGFAPTCFVHAGDKFSPVIFAPDACKTFDDLLLQPQFAIMMPVAL